MNKKYVGSVYPIAGVEWIDDSGIGEEDGVLFSTLKISNSSNRSSIANNQRLIKWSNFKKKIGESVAWDYVDAQNIGVDPEAVGVFAGRVDKIYGFKSLVPGNGVSITDNGTDLRIEIDSFDSGFQLPSIFESERDAIIGPVAGALLFNKDSKQLNWYTGTEWKSTNS